MCEVGSRSSATGVGLRENFYAGNPSRAGETLPVSAPIAREREPTG